MTSVQCTPDPIRPQCTPDPIRPGRRSNWYCGILNSIIDYSNDVQHGISMLFHTNGVIDTVACFENGMPCGLVTQWYDNGTIRMIDPHEGDGPVRRWYDNGIMRSDGYRINEQYYGLYTQWYSNGVLEKSGFYSNGVEYGTWMFCNIDGSTNKVTQYKMEKDINRKNKE